MDGGGLLMLRLMREKVAFVGLGLVSGVVSALAFRRVDRLPFARSFWHSVLVNVSGIEMLNVVGKWKFCEAPQLIGALLIDDKLIR